MTDEQGPAVKPAIKVDAFQDMERALQGSIKKVEKSLKSKTIQKPKFDQSKSKNKRLEQQQTKFDSLKEDR